jgi:hypothetical protein
MPHRARGACCLSGMAGPAGSHPRSVLKCLSSQIRQLRRKGRGARSPRHWHATAAAALSYAGWEVGSGASCRVQPRQAAMAGPMTGFIRRAVLGSAAERERGTFRHSPSTAVCSANSDAKRPCAANPGRLGPHRKPEEHPVRILQIVLPALRIRSHQPQRRARQQPRGAP